MKVKEVLEVFASICFVVSILVAIILFIQEMEKTSRKISKETFAGKQKNQETFHDILPNYSIDSEIETLRENKKKISNKIKEKHKIASKMIKGSLKKTIHPSSDEKSESTEELSNIIKRLDKFID